MGLDTYAVIEEDGQRKRAPADAFPADLRLCGGLLSGHGDTGSFRGKVYSDLIESITGESLYQEFIPPATVAEMSRKLDADDGSGFEDEGLGYKDLPDLRRFFAVCRERGFGLVGWW